MPVEVAGDSSSQSDNEARLVPAAGTDLAAPAPAPAPRCQPRALVTQGALRIMILVATLPGLWDGLYPACPPGVHVGADGGLVVGAVLLPAWALVVADSPAADEACASMRGARCRAQFMYGFIENLVEEACSFLEPQALARGAPRGPTLVRSFSDCQVTLRLADSDHCFAPQSFLRVLARWTSRCPSASPAFIDVAPTLATNIAQMHWRCLNSVPITLRVKRSGLLFNREPSTSRLRAWVAHLRRQRPPQATAVPEQTALVSRSRTANFAFQPDLIIDWVEATSFLKNMRKADPAAIAFGRLYARSSGLSSVRLSTELNKINTETLRQARVRLDVVSMLIFRALFQRLHRQQGDAVNIYLWCDSSPQYRGLEMFSATVELFDGHRFVRRLMPCIALDKTMLDTSGKALTLLFQLFLMGGGAYVMTKACCERVRGITTDMGVERRVVDIDDCTADLYRKLAPSLDVEAPAVGAKLFPRALGLPGWKHSSDLLLRRGLASLRAFPGWLRLFKSVLSFFRQDTHRVLVVRSLRQRSLGPLADMLAKSKLPSFADWRWDTLHLALEALDPMLDSLRVHFDPRPFRSSRAGTGLNEVISAFKSDGWRQVGRFVLWLCRFLCGLMSWGGGCDCHQDALANGEPVACEWEGRRIRTAWEHISSTARAHLEEASRWTTMEWGVSHDPHGHGWVRQRCV